MTHFTVKVNKEFVLLATRELIWKDDCCTGKVLRVPVTTCMCCYGFISYESCQNKFPI